MTRKWGVDDPSPPHHNTRDKNFHNSSEPPLREVNFHRLSWDCYLETPYRGFGQVLALISCHDSSPLSRLFVHSTYLYYLVPFRYIPSVEGTKVPFGTKVILEGVTAADGVPACFSACSHPLLPSFDHAYWYRYDSLR